MDIEGITKKINGGTNGLEDRKARTQKVLAVLQNEQGG
jgi:predicted chitinase